MSCRLLHQLPQRWIRAIGIPLIRTLYRIRVVHPERLPAAGGCLLLPNHITFADAFFISAACPRPLRFVMDEAFMASRWIRLFVSIFDTVTIRRDQPREAIRITITALNAGDVVCLFPEGQLTRTGALGELRRGFELIAKKAGQPLIPLWCDGAWGSIFSFQGGRYFRKLPTHVPYPLTLAFGEPLTPETASRTAVQAGLLVAAAEAQAARFAAAEWASRVPRGEGARVREFMACRESERRAAWVNGHQIGQTSALPRQQPLAMLTEDSELDEVAALRLTFADLFDASVESYPAFTPLPGIPWLGGRVLRDALHDYRGACELAFYDFSDQALVPLNRDDVQHFPCLAVGGVVIAMSQPNPPNAPGADPQLGWKPGSWGKLLPGWFLQEDAGGRLWAHGPAAPAGGIVLPEGCSLDDENFLVASATSP